MAPNGSPKENEWPEDMETTGKQPQIAAVIEISTKDGDTSEERCHRISYHFWVKHMVSYIGQWWQIPKKGKLSCK